MTRQPRKFPPELLQKIRDAVSILEVVGEHVVLRKSGANYVGLCPFHSERSPSFSVNDSKQLYHCYGCKKGGDLFSFVMDLHAVSFPEAIEELAERARIPLPKEFYGGSSDDPEVEQRRRAAQEKLATAHRLNRFALSFYGQSLKKMPSALSYLRKRGVTEDWERAFYAGAAPASWDALARRLVEGQAPLPLAQELGLIRTSTKPGGPGYFDLFRNRLMFPILDMRGRVAGFGGRLMPASGPEGADAAGGDGPKYLNSPESVLFQKSKLAFGLFQAQKHIREADEVIIVEGYFDVTALHAAGFGQAVATCGTSLTPEHLAIFRRFASRITVLFDGDEAGVNATERAMELGLQHGLIVHGASLPEDLDPDELLFDPSTGKPLAEGKERMTAILKDAKPLLDARIGAAIAEAAQGPEARTQALKRIGGWLAKFTDPVGREVRLDDAVQRLGISRDLLLRAMGGATSGSGTRVPTQSRPMVGVSGGSAGASRPGVAAAPGSGPARGGFERPPAAAAKGRGRGRGGMGKVEAVLLGGVVRGAEFSGVLDAGRAKLPPNTSLAELFEYEPAREWVQSLLEHPLAGKPEELATRLPADLDPVLRDVLIRAAIAPAGKISEDDVRGALDRCLAKSWARFSQGIRTALAEAEAKKDAGLQAKLMQEYLDVQRKMKEFISFYDEA